MIGKGIDPAVEQERERQAALRKQSNTFAAVAEEFIKHNRRLKLRTADDMEYMLRQSFVKRWKSRAITDISSQDVKAVIAEAVNRDAPYQAFKLFALIRRLFNWAIGTDDYAIVRQSLADGRFAPESGQIAESSIGPLSAKSRHKVLLGI